MAGVPSYLAQAEQPPHAVLKQFMSGGVGVTRDGEVELDARVGRRRHLEVGAAAEDQKDHRRVRNARIVTL